MTPKFLLALLFAGLSALAGAPPPAPPVEPPDAPPEAADPEAAPEATDPEVEAIRIMVDELMGEVERRRGLSFRTEFTRDVYRPEELREKATAMLDDEMPPETRRRLEARDARLGYYPPGLDLAETLSEFLAVGAAGYYDPRAKSLHVQRGFKGPGAKPIVFHELVHALDDQHFDLAKLQAEAQVRTDRTLALSAVVEGAATLFMTDYMTSDVAAMQAMMAEIAQQAAEQEAALAKMPVALSAMMGFFPYVNGLSFVKRITRGDPKLVDRLYENLPVSTEQVMHPHKFGVRGDFPYRIELPDFAAVLPDGYERGHEDALGELAIGILLNEFAGGTNREKLARITGGMLNPGIVFAGEVRKAAEGWDGDVVLSFDGPEGNCAIVWASRWDRPVDAEEFAELLKAGLPGKWERSGLHPATALVEVSGDRVLVVEGFPEESLRPIADAAWAETRFDPDPRDRTDAAPK